MSAGVGQGSWKVDLPAAAMKRDILAMSFTPGDDSTPLATSTAYGRTARTAAATFSGVRPPARMTGATSETPSASDQSKGSPLPP